MIIVVLYCFMHYVNQVLDAYPIVNVWKSFAILVTILALPRS